MDERSERSKYFRKHYTVEEPDLFETVCPWCKSVFAIDYRWCEYKSEIDGDFAVISCPYCHKIYHECI